MSKKQREIEVFGLSFMDMISCGLGGVIVLMLIFSTLVKQGKDREDGQEGFLVESSAAMAKRQSTRNQCHFYLEVDVLTGSEQNQAYLAFQRPLGVTVDSIIVRGGDFDLRFMKRYVISYSLPGKVPTREFQYRLVGVPNESCEARLRLLTDHAILENIEFEGNLDFKIKKIAKNYFLKT